MLTDLDLTTEKPISSPAAVPFITPRSKSGVQILLIVLAAAFLCLPCLSRGLPAGTNAATHIKYQHHFSDQFWNGEKYPRWLAPENKGYGSPIFLIQYPLPYFTAALLRPITSFPAASRESRELGLTCFLALVGAGLGAWSWFRKFTEPMAATLAAITYISLPYVLQDGIYTRTAIGELFTFIWMPMALSLCESLYERRSVVFVLSGVFALLVMSNLLSAVLFAPVLTIYAVLSGKRFELSRFRRARLVLVSQLLGAGMAAIYLVPLLAYRRMFDLHQMGAILPGYQLGLYFLNITSFDLRSRVIDIAIGGAIGFTAIAGWSVWRAAIDVRVRIGMLLALILGMLALVPNLGHSVIRLSGFDLRPAPESSFSATMLLGISFTVALGFMAYCRVVPSRASERGFLLLCFAWVAFFLMLPFSAPIWKSIPGSSVIQFPFRLAGILCLAVAGLVSMAFDSAFRERDNSPRPLRLVFALAVFAAIAGGLLTYRMDRVFRHPQIAEFNAAEDIDPMYRAYVPLPQLAAFAESLGTHPESYIVEPRPGDGTLRAALIDGDCELNVLRESPRALLVSSNCKDVARIRIGQLYSPLWKVVPDPATSSSSSVGPSSDGAIELRLYSGKHDTRLVFDIGRPERWGTIVSGVSLLIGLFGFVYFRIRNTQVPGKLAV